MRDLLLWLSFTVSLHFVTPSVLIAQIDDVGRTDSTLVQDTVIRGSDAYLSPSTAGEWLPSEAARHDWTIEVAPLWMQRSRASRYEIGRFVLPSGSTLETLDARDAAFGFKLGMRAEASKSVDEFLRLQAVFAFIDGWNETEVTTGPGASRGVSRLFGSASVLDGGIGDAFHYSAQTSLYSGELNLDRQFNPSGTRWIGGLRYFHFADSMNLAADDRLAGFSSRDIEFLSVDARNDLIGFQVGIEQPLRRGRLTLSLFSRVGGFMNFTRQTTNSSGIAGQFPGAESDSGELAIASSLEGGLRARLRITNWLHLLGSYSFLGLRGVATASGQLAATNNVSGLLAVNGLPLDQLDFVDHDSSLWMHGFTATAEIIW